MNGPESWKTKCSIRRADEVAMTDNGTLILRRDSLPPLDTAGQTARFHVPSIAPFAIDVPFDFPDEEDHLPPARNSDALGLRTTREVEAGRSVTRGSFFAGLSAGLTAVALAGALAFVAFTSEAFSSHAFPRSPNAVAHGNASLAVARPDLAIERSAPKKRAKKVRVTEEVVADAEEPAAPRPLEIPVEKLPTPQLEE